MTTASERQTGSTKDNGVVLETALRAECAGISVIPVATDGSKRPDLNAWSTFQQRRATAAEIREWFNEPNRTGVAFVCGEVSGGLEMLEWETQQAFEDFEARALQSGKQDLAERVCAGYLEQSGGGGFHTAYRCPGAVEGNQPLAHVKEDSGGFKVAIETRGEGGCMIVAPSYGGVNPRGPYVLVRGGINSIVTLSAEEREDLLSIARSLNQKPRRTYEPSDSARSRGRRPGDRYNREKTWQDVLAPHGWRIHSTDGEETYWTRPGKSDGVSATTNYANSDLLWVFTTSTAFDAGSGYDKFAAYAVLVHGGDFTAAAQALAAMGLVDSDEARTDSANARLFAEEYSDRLRYIFDRKTWFVREGPIWNEAHEAVEVMRLARLVPQNLREEAATLQSAERTSMREWAKKLESVRALRAMVDLARSEEDLALKSEHLDANPFLLGCPSTIIDLRTGQPFASSEPEYVTRSTAVDPFPACVSSEWESFLDDLTDGDRQLREFLQCAVGRSVFGTADDEYFFYLFGPGATGKSTFLEAIGAALGGYAGPAAFTTFSSRTPQDDAQQQLVSLRGTRFAFANEVNHGEYLNAALIKQITSGETIKLRVLYQGTFDYRPQFSLWFAANEPLSARSADDGFWRRAIIIPVEQVVPLYARDGSLKRQLTEETFHQRAVLAWILEGARKYHEAGRLTVPDSLRNITANQRQALNPLAAFVDDCVVRRTGHVVSVGQMNDRYVVWAQQQTEPDRISVTRMKGYLDDLGIRQRRHGDQRFYEDVDLVASDESAADAA